MPIKSKSEAPGLQPQPEGDPLSQGGPLSQKSFYHVWVVFRDFIEQIGFNPWVFMPPVILGLLAALAEGASIGLLIPTIQGVLAKSFIFIQQKPFLREFFDLFQDNAFRSNASIFIFLILAIFFFSALKNLLLYVSSVMTTYQVRECANKTRKKIYERYLAFGKLFFDHASAGHLHQVLTGYTQQISQELRVLQSCLTTLFSFIVYMAIAFFISWKLTLFSTIIFPVLHYSVQTIIRKIKRSSEDYAKAYSEMGKKISNALSCIMLVEAYSHENREKEWFAFTSDKVRNFQFSIDKKQLFFGPFQEIVGLCMILLLVAAMAFLLIREKSGDVAGFFVFFVVLRRASSGFGVFNSFQSTLAGIRGPLKEIRNILSDENKFFIPDGTRMFDHFRDKIEFRQLDFRYVEDRSILEKVSFSVRKGETVAIVGSSGSGKTTLVNLLLRFYDSAPGSILIDGTDIREFKIASLRSQMALVSQDTLLLNASFKVNLLYGLTREVSEAEIEKVLDRSQLSSLVNLIGITAELGDRGVKLSGGERQRLSIARSMLKNPEILLLDEATSSLDTTTEGLIQAALNEAAKDKTVIVIAHRLSTIQHADRIVVLECGRVVEEGTFEQLVANIEGYFYSYWQNQKLRGESAES